jgi:hypothetical protein
MEDDPTKMWEKNGRRPKKKIEEHLNIFLFWKTRIKASKKIEDNLQKKMEDDLKKREDKKRKTNQSTKINLIGCDTNVNPPS